MNTIHCAQCNSVVTRNIHKNTRQPFCNIACYAAWQSGKSFFEQSKPLRQKKSCSVDGCEYVHFGKGYCRRHYIKFVYSLRPPTKQSSHKNTIICVQCGKHFPPPLKNSKFCSSQCFSDSVRKPFIIKKGYKKVLIKGHPRSDKKGYVFEHIIIAEATIGRSLIAGEEIHHIDFNRLNNSQENLLICSSHEEHMKYHNKQNHSPKL